MSGIPPNPGPRPQEDKFAFDILVWNIHSLSTYLPSIITRSFDLCFCQEISVPWRKMGAMHTRLRNLGIKSLLTGIDPETLKTGGVGALSWGKVPMTRLKPTTPKLQSLVNSGRMQLVGLTLPDNVMLTVCILYLWTNGHSDPASALRSDDLPDAVFFWSLTTYPQDRDSSAVTSTAIPLTSPR